MTTSAENNKTIAKNTLLLYFRMMLTMIVSLYTSRIVMKALGVEDFGIYNVVGGVVAMFNVLSGSLSSAISRFITFELGKNNKEKLKKVFSSSVTIQFILAVLIVIVAEFVGVWFINEKMNIATERLSAANWVFHFSILTFVFNLISVPYNAVIVAHERMSAFAYISIIEVLGKLSIAYFINISPIDRLVFYAILMWFVAVIIRFVYVFYCKRNFEECNYHFTWDKQLIKQMFSFAGWNFIGSSSAILRDQGSNIILNLFFGTTINAARGIAYQVYSAIYSFITNFMTAINPQITKSYAIADYTYMMKLIYKGSSFASYLLFALSLPVLINADYLLHLWLDVVPEYTVLFVRLILIFALSESISGPLITAQLATGNIRNYQLLVGGLQMLNLPLSFVVLNYGGGPELVFVIAIIISQLCLACRLFMLRRMINLSVSMFFRNVYTNILLVFFIASILPVGLSLFLEEKLLNFLILTSVSVVSSSLTILYVGCSNTERLYLIEKIRKMTNKICL